MAVMEENAPISSSVEPAGSGEDEDPLVMEVLETASTPAPGLGEQVETPAIVKTGLSVTSSEAAREEGLMNSTLSGDDHGGPPTFYIMVKLGSAKDWTKALVDTGSDRTLVSDALAMSQTIPYLLRLRSAGGQLLRVKGKCNGTLWTMSSEGLIHKTALNLVVVNGVAFNIFLGKDWIHDHVKNIDIDDRCLTLKNGAIIPMLQGDSNVGGQRSLAVKESTLVQGYTGQGFTLIPGLRQIHSLMVRRDMSERDDWTIPSMDVELPSHIQAKVDCELSWSDSRELILTTISGSGTPWVVEPDTVVAVEEASQVNRWNGIAFSLLSMLKVPAGVGSAISTIVRSSRPLHRNMQLNLEQVHDEGAQGLYQVFHTGSGGSKAVQQVTVINLTEQELTLSPAGPLMIHVEEWNKAKSSKKTEGDEESK